jgi:hypothetical protein
MKYRVIHHRTNVAHYPDIIGMTYNSYDDIPGGAIVRRVITCCGDELILRNFTTTCDHCDADYNQSGDLLAPRSQWGEETGEHWSDAY